MENSRLEAKGLFAGLFDFGFTTFITLKFLRVIYIVLMALILLGGLVFFLRLVSEGGASVLVALIVVPLVTLLYLVFARIYMELIALFFRIGENTSVIAARLGGPAADGPGGAGPQGPVPPAGDGYGTPPPV